MRRVWWAAIGGAGVAATVGGVLLSAPLWVLVVGVAAFVWGVLMLAGRGFPSATLAVLGIGLAAIAIAQNDAGWRFALGTVALLCAVAAGVLWVVRWVRDGGRLPFLGTAGRGLRRHAPLIVCILALGLAAVAAADGWHVAILAGLLAVGGGAVNVRLHHPWPTVLAGTTAAAVVVLSFHAGGLWLVLVVVAAAGYFVVFFLGQATQMHATRRDLWERVAKLAGRVVGSTVLLGVGIVGAALVLGRILAANATPIPFAVVWVAALVLALVVVVLVAWWWRSYEEMVLGRERPGYLTGLLLGLVVVGVALGAVDPHKEPETRLDQDVRADRIAGLGRFDLLLVVDPGDPVGKALIARAKGEAAPTPKAPDGGFVGATFLPRVIDSPFDLALGIVVPQHPDGPRPLWRLLEPPTTDARELGRALATLEPRDRPATGSYGRILSDVGSEGRVPWRRDARRGVAFLLAELPRGGEFAVPASGACELPATIPERPVSEATPTAWRDSAVRACLAREEFARWHVSGRPSHVRVEPPVLLQVVTLEERERRLAAWRSWARGLGGRLDAWRAGGELDDVTAFHLLHDAADLHTGAPVGELAEAARKHRPVLRFDRDDTLRPVDVDWLLGPDRRPPPLVTSVCAPGPVREDATCGTAEKEDGDVQEVCVRGDIRETCERIRAATQLASERAAVIDLAGDGAPKPGAKDPPRMYVDVWERGRNVFLGYWWFYRYNTSPWRSEINCLPGVTFGGLSCHDHEGDWEGVTVILERRDAGLEPVGAMYDAHGRPIRWDWQDLRVVDGRPEVFVAVGSHASYPRPCTEDECDQGLAHADLGEGGFDGERQWEFNSDKACDAFWLGEGMRTHGPCLHALPSMYDPLLDDPDTGRNEGRRGVLWNAFPGRWGRARCTAIGRVCVQIDGPRPPSRQGRFTNPSDPDGDGKLDCGPRDALEAPAAKPARAGGGACARPVG